MEEIKDKNVARCNEIDVKENGEFETNVIMEVNINTI